MLYKGIPIIQMLTNIAYIIQHIVGRGKLTTRYSTRINKSNQLKYRGGQGELTVGSVETVGN